MYETELEQEYEDPQVYITGGEWFFEAAQLYSDDKYTKTIFYTPAYNAFSKGFSLMRWSLGWPQQSFETLLRFAETSSHVGKNTEAFKLFKKAAKMTKCTEWPPGANVEFGFMLGERGHLNRALKQYQIAMKTDTKAWKEKLEPRSARLKKGIEERKFTLNNPLRWIKTCCCPLAGYNRLADEELWQIQSFRILKTN